MAGTGFLLGLGAGALAVVAWVRAHPQLALPVDPPGFRQAWREVADDLRRFGGQS
ncbi:MAG: hypothetical protein JWM31_107 [Solirubrobacterales bacterium]|nr:hypothetical protein [Solirubrobacterales bacterium]